MDRRTNACPERSLIHVIFIPRTDRVCTETRRGLECLEPSKEITYIRRESIRRSMDTKLIGLTVGTWLIFMVAAIANAVIREAVYGPVVGNLVAHQISTFVFMAMILLITFLVFRFADVELSVQQAFLIGAVWLVLTVAFEFLAGHYVFGNPWEKLLADYNLLQGRIWGLILVTVLFAPYLANELG